LDFEPPVLDFLFGLLVDAAEAADTADAADGGVDVNEELEEEERSEGVDEGEAETKEPEKKGAGNAFHINLYIS